MEGCFGEVFEAILGVIWQILGAILGPRGLARANIIGKEQLFLSKVMISLGFLIVFDVPGIGLKGNFGSHLGLLGAILKV